ncbi:hypothetical protein CEXT_177441 [Caerostris extrusa]|uniref:Uncharacterized protein n=1 Tax=Caerostris extrusa TaxID=172846 RepID=A0AAV4M853_CAEEX|nr:hypothetical protein CEXT_177441 [Caerostris extrusa]
MKHSTHLSDKRLSIRRMTQQQGRVEESPHDQCTRSSTGTRCPDFPAAAPVHPANLRLLGAKALARQTRQAIAQWEMLVAEGEGDEVISKAGRYLKGPKGSNQPK